MRAIFHSKSLKINIASNFIGNLWSAVISFIFVPFYIRYIGAEGYGLLGVFVTLQNILLLLDGGLSTTLNKEVARLSALDNSANQMRNLVRTLETVYWSIAIVIGIIALAMSPVLAHSWIQSEELSADTTQKAFMLLGVSLIFQFPIGFYSGGLLGLQHHAALNGIRIFFSTLRSAGALLVLMYYSSSILAFFSWILLVTIFNAICIVWVLWRYMPAGSKPRFDKSELKRIWKFVAGMSGIALTSMLLLQVDKVILSRVLTLEQFGYYTLAGTLSFVLYQISGPITQSYFPRFSALAAKEDTAGLRKSYHQGCQLISVALLPAAGMLVLFSKELLMIWTNNAVAVSNMWEIASIFAFGTAFHGLMLIPYMLTIAHGYTRLAFVTNLVLLVLVIPGVLLSSIYYGGLGAVCCWAGLNIIYFLIVPTLIHRRVLKGEETAWYLNDTLKPLIVTAIVLIACRYLIPLDNLGRWQKLVILIGIGTFALGFAALSVKSIRAYILNFLRKRTF